MIDKVTIFSLLNILIVKIKYRTPLVRYKSIDRVGRFMLKALIKYGICLSESGKIDNLYLFDSQNGHCHEFAHIADLESRKIRKKILPRVQKIYSSELSAQLTSLISLSVSKFMITNFMNSGLVLMNYAVFLKENPSNNIGNVFYVSSFYDLFKGLNIEQYVSKIKTISI